jgi:pimeloyl-ACP methyl ester carboxylesterase
MSTDSARRRVLLRRHGGITLDVVVEGAGPAVVLLPSSLRDSLADFDAVAAQVAAAGHTVLRPQPRGMGRSRGPMQGLTLHDLAADVAEVIRTLGSGRAVVVGHAFGHFIARVADLDHPALVRGIVVAAGAARSFPPGLQAVLDTAADAAQPHAERLQALRLAFFAAGNDAAPWLDGWYPELRATYRAAGAVPDKSVWWPVTNAPVLDLQAADDPWRPAATRDELRAVLGADRVTVQVIEGASHALVCERPAAVAKAIVDWVGTLS